MKEKALIILIFLVALVSVYFSWRNRLKPIDIDVESMQENRESMQKSMQTLRESKNQGWDTPEDAKL